MKNTKIQIVEGDITRMPADAIITAINSGGMWYGGIGDAIQRVAGDLYHSQARAAMPLQNLQTVVANGSDEHEGSFKDVVFVVDDLQSPLNEVIYRGLEAASNEGYHHVLVPTIRMGIMAGVVEKTQQEAIEKMSQGVRKFLNDYHKKTRLKTLKFVAYNNSVLAESMDSAFRRI